MADVLLTDKDIEAIVQSTADDIKKQMQRINEAAAKDFYSVEQNFIDTDSMDMYEAASNDYNMNYQGYDRTGDFANLAKTPKEVKKGKGIDLIYEYSANDLGVNEWYSPWGINYPGSSEWAFDTGFIHGLHGGPRPAGKNLWNWGEVQRSTPIWDLIVEGIENLE